MSTLTSMRDDLAEWRARFDATPERDAPFTSLSGEPVAPLYTAEDLPADPEAAIGLPGRFPFTRGVCPWM